MMRCRVCLLLLRLLRPIVHMQAQMRVTADIVMPLLISVWSCLLTSTSQQSWMLSAQYFCICFELLALSRSNVHMQEQLGMNADTVWSLQHLLQAALQDSAPTSHTQCVFQLLCHAQPTDRQLAHRYGSV